MTIWIDVIISVPVFIIDFFYLLQQFNYDLENSGVGCRAKKGRHKKSYAIVKNSREKVRKISRNARLYTTKTH